MEKKDIIKEENFKQLNFEIIGSRKLYPNRYEPIKLLKDGFNDISCRFYIDDKDRIVAEYKCPKTGNFYPFGYVNSFADEISKCNSSEYFRKILDLCMVDEKMPKIEANILKVNDGSNKMFVFGYLVEAKIYFEPTLQAAIEEIKETSYKKEFYEKTFYSKETILGQIDYYANKAASEGQEKPYLVDKINSLKEYAKTILIDIKIASLNDESVSLNETLKTITPLDLDNSNIMNALFNRISKYKNMDAFDLESMKKNPIQGLESLKGIDFNEKDLSNEITNENKKEFGQD